DFAGNDLARQTQAEREDIGVVPAARSARGLSVSTQCGSDARYLVRSDADAGAGPAADDSLLCAARCHGFANGAAYLRPLQRLSGQWADQFEFVSTLAQFVDEGIGQMRAFIAAYDQSHAETVPSA